jgi:dihydropteroate synthase
MDRAVYQFCPRNHFVKLQGRTCVVGVINITPDSFSDGGRYLAPADAVARCVELVEAGADMVELGAESTRPGADPISVEEELGRLLPVLEVVRDLIPKTVIIDTCKAEVARAALRLGADVINDVTALSHDPDMAGVIAEHQAGVILMHMRGTPKTMQTLPPSRDILGEIRNDLLGAVRLACDAGIRRDRIVLDPGIGFGKTFEDNLKILNQLPFMFELGFPVMVGTSRKSFIGRITGSPPEQRIFGTVASVVLAVLRGAHMVRVHDVREVAEAIKVTDSILTETIRE